MYLILLRYKRQRLHTESIFFAYAGNLWIAYKPSADMFEPFAILRRALFSVAGVLATDLQRSKILILLCVLSLMVHFQVKPYAWATDNVSELMGLVVLTLIATLQTGFEDLVGIPIWTQKLIVALILLTVLFICVCCFSPEWLWPGVVKQAVIGFSGVDALRQKKIETAIEPGISVLKEAGHPLHASATPEVSPLPNTVEIASLSGHITTPEPDWEVETPSVDMMERSPLSGPSFSNLDISAAMGHSQYNKEGAREAAESSSSKLLENSSTSGRITTPEPDWEVETPSADVMERSPLTPSLAFRASVAPRALQIFVNL
eukprot:g60226.t1